MKYFLDTEFHEYKRKVKFLGITLKEIDTIDLISIGIVSEAGRDFYAINRDFDIKAAWENEWLRINVLYEIYNHLKYSHLERSRNFAVGLYKLKFSLKYLTFLVRTYGYSQNAIANDICEFIYGEDD